MGDEGAVSCTGGSSSRSQSEATGVQSRLEISPSFSSLRLKASAVAVTWMNENRHARTTVCHLQNLKTSQILASFSSPPPHHRSKMYAGSNYSQSKEKPRSSRTAWSCLLLFVPHSQVTFICSLKTLRGCQNVSTGTEQEAGEAAFPPQMCLPPLNFLFSDDT